MEDTFGMIFTRITHINFEEITEFMNTTNYTIEQYNVLKEKVKLAKDSINGYKRSCTDDSKILLVICLQMSSHWIKSVSMIESWSYVFRFA